MLLEYTSYTTILAFFKFIRGTHCFKFLRARLPKATIDRLNDVVRLRCKIARESVKVEFIKQCILSGIFPRNYFKTVRRNKLHPSIDNLVRHSESDLDSTYSMLRNLRSAHLQLLSVLDDISVVCQIMFYNFCRDMVRRTKEHTRSRLNASLSDENASSNFASDLDRYVVNRAGISLTKTQKEALSVGLKFCIPPSRLNVLECGTQFENIFDQLKDLSPSLADAAGWLKARLVDLAHQYRIETELSFDESTCKLVGRPQTSV